MPDAASPTEKNIVITGFMGTGKSTVGRLLAARLGRAYVDLDEEIEARFAKPIPRIFAEDGEPVFRVAESQLCRHYAQSTGLVLSTGGGALINPENRAVLGQSGVLICLTATVDAILERVERADNRPLLPGDRDARRGRIRHLLNERRQAYAAIPHQIDTTGLTPEQIVDQITTALHADLEAPGMALIPVRTPEGSYDICLGEGLLQRAGSLLAARGLRTGPAALISNPDIAACQATGLVQSLERAGFSPVLCTLPEGEQHKTLDAVRLLYDHFLAAGLDRRGAVIALGGGVVGDIAGFAAATYLRGVPFVQIPTSLLAMVDSSVGGKTGVDLPQGKNLVGAFKQPQAVIIDPGVLETLPAPEFRSGLAEVIKHGIIGNADLFEQLENTGPLNMTRLVADAVRVKVRIVEEDPFEQGRRALLNLGHTFGHAIELVSDFTVRHGEGVALGLIASSQLSVHLGRCPAELSQRIVRVVERLGLPTRLSGYAPQTVMDAMAHDKKRSGKMLRFVIPQALEDVVVIDSPGPDQVLAALETVLG
jgi:3-dehydroquinate synthase